MSETTGIEWTEATWNAVVGCSQVSEGCRHCLDPKTIVLMGDLAPRQMGDLRTGDTVLSFGDGARQYPTLRAGVVTSIVSHYADLFRIDTTLGPVNATADHRWKRHFSSHWPTTRRLQPGKPIRYLSTSKVHEDTRSYRRGYISGMTWGDGTLRYDPHPTQTTHERQVYWRVALTDAEPLQRLKEYLAEEQIGVEIRPFRVLQNECHKPMQRVETRRARHLSQILDIVIQSSPDSEYKRGWLAGIFDAEGSYSRNLRISNTNPEILDTVLAYGRDLGFDFEWESYPRGHCPTARLRGTLSDRVRFFATVRPAIGRKMGELFDRAIRSLPAFVTSVSPLGSGEVIDIEVNPEHTFYADGFATHNCYAETLDRRFRMQQEDREYRPWTHPNAAYNVRVFEDRLGLPKRWKRPRMIFVNSRSDMFHEAIPFGFRARMWETIRDTPRHTFQILTKRPENISRMLPADWDDGYPNVWLGVSGETVDIAYERGVKLYGIPAALHFLSAEPWLEVEIPHADSYLSLVSVFDWVILGGESGPNARRMNLASALALRDATVLSDVPFFFKQWGGVSDKRGHDAAILDGRTWKEFPTVTRAGGG